MNCAQPLGKGAPAPASGAASIADFGTNGEHRPKGKRRVPPDADPRSLAEDYLRERGLLPETATSRFGVEIESLPDPAQYRERLAGLQLPEGTKVIIWIPIYNKAGGIESWVARLLPTPAKIGKFVCPQNSAGPPWVPPELYDHKGDSPLVVTEGPIKGMVLTLAGYDTVALNGVWCAAAKRANDDDSLALRNELRDLRLLGRKVYLAFDADQNTKIEVRHALIRLFLLLCNAGAEIYQLTSWLLVVGKGIDDYLVRQTDREPGAAIQALIDSARPFIETLSPTLSDAQLVETELAQIEFGPLVRDQLTKRLAGALNVRVELLRELVAGPAKPKPEASFAATYQPWPEAVDGQALFNEIVRRIQNEAVIPPAQLCACALWAMLTWVHGKMEFSPLLYISGPTKECGKTSLLSVIGKMVRRPLKTGNCSAAAMFRLSELYHPTFLMDEAQDQLRNPDFALVIKNGHQPGDYAIRCDANTNAPVTFDVFCPKLVAGIGRLGGAQILSRSIIIDMERKRHETLDRSVKINDPIFVELRRKLAQWSQDVGDLSCYRLPKQIAVRLRDADNWEVLYQIACAVSQDLAEQLIEYLPDFIDRRKDSDFDTYLLSSLRELFTERGMTGKDDVLPSSEIVKALDEDEEAPWRAKGDHLTAESLARRLRKYKAQTHKMQKGGKRAWSYRYGDLDPVFSKYL